MITTSEPKKIKREDMPPLAVQAFSLMRAGLKTAARVIHGQAITRTPEQQSACLLICTGDPATGAAQCEQWVAAKNRCQVCGCHGQWKARVAASDCPLHKWPAVEAPASESVA